MAFVGMRQPAVRRRWILSGFIEVHTGVYGLVNTMDRGISQAPHLFADQTPPLFGPVHRGVAMSIRTIRGKCAICSVKFSPLGIIKAEQGCKGMQIAKPQQGAPLD